MDNAHALVIGIADYQNIRALPQTQDAQAIYNLLIDPLYCGYHLENAQLLSDGQATLAAWRQALANLAQRSNAETTVFLYFSGHGGRIETGACADEYLLPVDVVDSSDQTVAQSAISGAEFTAALRAIPARQIVVVFDCCHAGGIGQPQNFSAPTLKPGLSENYYEALKSGRGRVILASSRSDEYSYVLSGAEHGLFTQHLLNGCVAAPRATTASLASSTSLSIFNLVSPATKFAKRRFAARHLWRGRRIRRRQCSKYRAGYQTLQAHGDHSAGRLFVRQLGKL
jgi:uncharacterized caspase-like protein